MEKQQKRAKVESLEYTQDDLQYAIIDLKLATIDKMLEVLDIRDLEFGVTDSLFWQYNLPQNDDKKFENSNILCRSSIF